MNPVLAAIIGLLGNFILSLGMVLQKRYVSWIGFKGAKDAAWRKEVLGWGAGFVLMNLAPIANYFALMGLAANVVGALIGSNVAFTALLIALFLKERLGAGRLAWTGLLFAALAVAGLRGGKVGSSLNMTALYACLAIPLLLALVALFQRRRKPGKSLAVLIAAIAGSFGGYMVLTMRALQIAAGPTFLSWLTTPFLYLYIVEGVSSFALINLAYKDGDMSAVSPAFYGMEVLWPAVASYAVLGTAFDLVQVCAFVGIALTVFIIARAGTPDTLGKPE